MFINPLTLGIDLSVRSQTGGVLCVISEDTVGGRFVGRGQGGFRCCQEDKLLLLLKAQRRVRRHLAKGPF